MSTTSPTTGGGSPPGAASPAVSPSQMRWLMGGLMLGLFVSSVEQSIVATALPTIAGDLGSPDQIAWVVSAYLLASTVVTPLYGKMSDLFGRRPVYLTGLVIFIVGSALCAVAPSMNTLVAARVVQGLGGGALLSLAFVIVGDVVSPRQRGRWIGLFTSIFTVSAITGPLIGGLLVDGPGWRWVFWSGVIPAIAALGVANRGLQLPFPTRRAEIDWLGIALLVVASTGLILVPIWGGDTYAWGSAQIVVTALVSIVATVWFVLHERRAAEPVVPMRLFADRTASAIFAMGLLLMGSLVAVMTFMPLFLQVATGRSATASGLMLTPQSIGISVTATAVGWFVSKTGRYKWTLIAGPAAAVVALLLLTTITPDIDTLPFALMVGLLGAALGLIFPNLTLTIQNAAPLADLGIATSTSNFFRNMGGAFGAAVGGAVVGVMLDSELRSRIGAAELLALGGADGVIESPDEVRQLPAELLGPVSEAVTASVVDIIWLVIPAMALIGVLGLLVRETPLRSTSAVGGDDG